MSLALQGPRAHDREAVTATERDGAHAGARAIDIHGPQPVRVAHLPVLVVSSTLHAARVHEHAGMRGPARNSDHAAALRPTRLRDRASAWCPVPFLAWLRGVHGSPQISTGAGGENVLGPPIVLAVPKSREYAQSALSCCMPPWAMDLSVDGLEGLLAAPGLFLSMWHPFLGGSEPPARGTQRPRLPVFCSACTVQPPAAVRDVGAGTAIARQHPRSPPGPRRESPRPCAPVTVEVEGNSARDDRGVGLPGGIVQCQPRRDG